MVALTEIGSFVLRGQQGDAAEALLRAAYGYRDGSSAWDAFPEAWRQTARDNARATLADFRNSIGSYPSPAELATVQVPVVCTYGARSPTSMAGLVRSLAAAIPTASTQQLRGRPRRQLRCHHHLRAADRRHHHLIEEQGAQISREYFDAVRLLGEHPRHRP